MNLLKSWVVGLSVVAGGLACSGRAEAKGADDIVAYTNRVRAEHGLAPLRVNDRLSDAALFHARNMARQYRMAHTLDGSDGGDRVLAFGYNWTHWGENIAYNWGYDDPAREAMVWWLNSPGHRANILAQDVSEIGVGIAASENGTLFYCQVFGSR
jgi:uncharacterized protein YkwD